MQGARSTQGGIRRTSGDHPPDERAPPRHSGARRIHGSAPDNIPVQLAHRIGLPCRRIGLVRSRTAVDTPPVYTIQCRLARRAASAVGIGDDRSRHLAGIAHTNGIGRRRASPRREPNRRTCHGITQRGRGIAEPDNMARSMDRGMCECIPETAPQPTPCTGKARLFRHAGRNPRKKHRRHMRRQKR